jgi:hypothetical protein
MNYENEKDFFPCKKDGSKLNIVEKIGFVAVNIVILLGYVGFRLGIGVLVVSLLCAIILSDYMSGQIDFWHAFYIMICDGRVIAFGLLVGCLFWLGELAG